MALHITKARIVPDLDVYNLFKCIDACCQSQWTVQPQTVQFARTHTHTPRSKSTSAKRCMQKTFRRKVFKLTAWEMGAALHFFFCPGQFFVRIAKHSLQCDSGAKFYFSSPLFINYNKNPYARRTCGRRIIFSASQKYVEGKSARRHTHELVWNNNEVTRCICVSFDAHKLTSTRETNGAKWTRKFWLEHGKCQRN